MGFKFYREPACGDLFQGVGLPTAASLMFKIRTRARSLNHDDDQLTRS
jgi:hypothetical protein